MVDSDSLQLLQENHGQYLPKANRSTEDTTPLPVLFDLPEDNQLFAALCSLKPMYRNVLYLYYFAGYRTEEIAGLLGKRAGTIRMQLLRGREQLRTQLQEEEGTVDG